ncbi:hypothetical protein K504DRAFT_372287 [Pleomassaria siparia CBS 279.74]|uniref:Impact N-terminal domain-containing protein n=1 Tax=Pleomassaria siparia CBS 279.74 TaxID=1314801 RepID=A0A6G1KIS3_9PLEO|nr:hypothetical protein K504DRAFT_372287 [Pleomassaria siparia CBS 279.74]
MASAQDIQTLLRFLTQDAKVPLVQAMGSIKQLMECSIITPAQIAKVELGAIKAIFGDDKITKQVCNAAKRISKKRGASDISVASPVKRAKPSYEGGPLSPAQLEDSLALPELDADEDKLSKVVVYTNRAPLVLAFAVTLLKYTMPEQPLSSRLSLSQSVVSANSRTRAANLGLETGKSAEEEGWGDGQPVVKVMGREVRVMKRWGYQWDTKEEEGSTHETVKEDPGSTEEPALWGVDLEALKKSNGPMTAGSRRTSTSHLPIFTAQSARSYLLKSFDSPKSSAGQEEKAKKKTNAAFVAEKERNLGLLLKSLELLFQSWSSILSKHDLDKRAWGWYIRVRPDVEHGVAGWGGKGDVKLSDILALRRTPD